MPKKHRDSNKTRKRKGKDMDEIAEQLKFEKRRCSIFEQKDLDLDLPGDDITETSK